MSELQVQARALGDPTRHAVFRFIVDADRPVGVAELTAHVGLNHNAVRQHLAKLVDAGLVVEAVDRPTGRGRPPLRYTMDPSANSRWGVVGPYERLSSMLSEVIRTGDTPLEVGRRFARRERLGSEGSAQPVEDFVERMARHGFEPSVSRRGDRFDITLQTCPFATTASTDPDTVCQLHLGLAYGIAEEVGGGLAIDALVPRDPRQAQCVLRCHVSAPDSSHAPSY